MDLLPEEVLLEVLQYLDVRDLLACRRVCKRLGALVLVGRVWRHRELRLGSPGVPAASPRERGPLHLLRLAPCLDHLYICAAAGTLRAITTTKCAVASLTLEDRYLGFNSQLYVEMVRHQEALGRLRRVHLDFRSSANSCRVLLDALTTLPRLESLTRSKNCRDRASNYASTAPVPHPSVQSLRKFSWKLTRDTVPFVHAVLAGHSATLEDVELKVGCSGWTSWTDDTVASLLAALPRLHSLRIDYPNIPGLPAVAACGALRKLCVDVGYNSTVVELLRRAKQLRDVRLMLDWFGLGCEVLQALASPALERLELRFCTLPCRNDEVRPLLRSMATLPALRHLVLDSSLYTSLGSLPLDLLQRINPATAPALRILELKMGRHPCPHTWVHEDAVHPALMANPSLHIQLEFLGAQECEKSNCVVCAMDCHKDVWKAGVGTNDILKLSIHLHELQIVVSSRVLKSYQYL
ncbi:uncharacterized protein LOC113214792 [Frankliniella occidentalis]|uniref:Uncharacterized protein LOC113214792 n=1 Tax=Frankliniella occidentalis TaxID=133901 RepID=A0A6J1T9T1_FRAOC|nr:uncharacterized protein LOC113214792 [Frankliniella occidentalis]